MRQAASERTRKALVARVASEMRRVATAAAVVAAVMLLGAAVLVASPARPAQAVGYQPDPPAGWTVVPLTEPAWANEKAVGDGVVAVSTRPADVWAVDAWFDLYRLADDRGATPPAQPVTTILRDYLRGQVVTVDSGLVVYSSVRPGTDPAEGVFDIHIRDLGSGAITKLPVGAPNIPEIVADAGRIVWSQWGFQHQPEIMLYDVATGTTTRLSEGPEAYRHPDIDGNDVVWQAWDGAEHRILHHDLATGVTRELAAGIPWMPELQPHVENGRVMWVQREWLDAAHTQWEEVLYLLDLATGTKEEVLSTGLPIAWVQAVLDGELLVTSVRQGDRPHDLVIRDLAAGTTRVLDDALEPPLSFSVDDGMVAWEDVTAHIAGGAETYHNRIMVFDAAAGTTRQLAVGSGLWQPRADNGRVVFTEWLDSENSRLWLATPDAAPPYDHFLDVPAASPYHEAILDFSAQGFVSGYLTGTFRTFHPAYPLLRAQLGKILSTSLGLAVDEQLSLPIPFRDLGADDPNDLYPHEYVAAATAAGLMQGYRPDAFGPWDRLTRAQMVTVVMRALETRAPHTLRMPPMGYVGTVHGAPTVRSTNLLLAEYNGLLDDLEGFGATWDPNEFARRGEVVQMLHGIPDIPVEASGTSEEGAG